MTIFELNDENCKDDKMHGKGEILFAHVGKYIGDYKEGLSDGVGTFTFSNGGKYVGIF